MVLLAGGLLIRLKYNKGTNVCFDISVKSFDVDPGIEREFGHVEKTQEASPIWPRRMRQMERTISQAASVVGAIRKWGSALQLRDLIRKEDPSEDELASPAVTH